MINNKWIDREIKKLQEQRKAMHTELRRLKSNAKSQKKLRDKQRMIHKKWVELNPGDNTLIIRDGPGRPNIECYISELQGVIMDIVNSGCNADPRRRSETLFCLSTLDELHDELAKRGIMMSRSATYLRLMPKDPTTNQGKLHVHTVPVRIFKPQNKEQKEHPSTRFCRADDRNLRELASFLGIHVLTPSVPHKNVLIPQLSNI